MRYYGGKARTGKEIAKILKEFVSDTKGYIEPFCGALGVMRHMSEYNCYASDGCKDLIMLWKEVQEDKFEKPEMTEEKWEELKESKIPSALRAYAGFGCSFGGQWFKGYAQKYSKVRNYNDSTYNGIQKIKHNIKKVKFSHRDYKKHHKKIENGGYLIYCDPPYTNSFQNHKGSTHGFDHQEFWNTMRKWTRWGNIVVVSERSAPKDFKCIWSKSLHNSVCKESRWYTDKLFKLAI